MAEAAEHRGNADAPEGLVGGSPVALAGMDLDGIMGAANNKSALCGALEGVEDDAVDAECQGLLDAARRLNEVNRQVRNLIAANVSARLDAITGSPQIYRAQSPAYAYAAQRAW